MIGFFNHTPSGCFWYRIKHPMDTLTGSGVPTNFIDLDNDVPYDDITAFQVYGIYPFSFAKVLKTFKADGKRIVYDLDDALELIDKTNPFYYSVMRDAASQSEILKYADHITVATQALKEYAEERTDVPVTVIPNCYSPREWGFMRSSQDMLRIGFAGSCTHIDDLLIVLPAIKKLQAKHNFMFVLMGFAPPGVDYPTWLSQFRFASTPTANKALDKFEKLMEGINFEWLPHVQYDLYPRQLTEAAFDIGICPLRNTGFNRARSTSKAMEYALSGALALASDISTYRHDPTSVLVKDNEWEAALEMFITSKEKRKAMAEEHLEWIKANRNIDSQIGVLKQVYGV